MFKLYSNFGIQLIELEQTVDKIVQISDSVPSEYARGKSKLDELRVELADRNMKKAQKLAETALDLYQEESLIASEYNRVVGSFNYTSPTMVELRNRYSKYLAAGNLEGARDALEGLASIRPLDITETSEELSAELASGAEGTLVRIVNSADSPATIVRVEVFSEGSALRTRRTFPFVIDAGSTLVMEFGPVSGPVSGHVNYRLHGDTHTIELE